MAFGFGGNPVPVSGGGGGSPMTFDNSLESMSFIDGVNFAQFFGQDVTVAPFDDGMGFCGRHVDVANAELVVLGRSPTTGIIASRNASSVSGITAESDGFHGAGQTTGDAFAFWAGSSVSGMETFQYTGDGATSRMIPHGFSATPDVVIVFRSASVVNARYLGMGSFARSWAEIGDHTDSLPGFSGRFAQDQDATNIYTTGTVLNNSGTVYNVIGLFNNDVQQSGIYTGNGTTTTLNLGFDPGFIIFSRDGSPGLFVLGPGFVTDAPRHAEVNSTLDPEAADVLSYTGSGVDLTGAAVNTNGVEYAYTAFRGQQS